MKEVGLSRRRDKVGSRSGVAERQERQRRKTGEQEWKTGEAGMEDRRKRLDNRTYRDGIKERQGWKQKIMDGR